ncbi:metal-dependent hydrolase [Halomarina pelagica]|uniref:metal-dependent hydrolase n=1 Tax=Halomarina pelagica TaxID=2961599 RepID=UPI0020C5320D|nr:metal-dependent hydrolase [Halomarina sp. BND7]
MWPWGHLALGYLCYHVYARWRGRTVDAIAVVALALGTQLPDLVDKPLAWTVAVLPAGRSLAHSVLFLLPLVAVVLAVGRLLDRRRAAGALLFGYAAHLLGDSVFPLVRGDLHELTFLVWPLLPLPTYSTEPSFAAHLANLGSSPTLAVELALTGLAALAWVRDGHPGWDRLLTAARRARGAASNR